MPGSTTGLSLGLDIGGTSVKGVLLDPARPDRDLRAARSEPYARPDRERLAAALLDVARALLHPGEPISAVGVCAPGLRDESGVIIRAVNVPGLEGASILDLIDEAVCRPLNISLAAQRGGGAVFEFSDAPAAALDFHRRHPAPTPPGRRLALSLGTGVGACVLDESPIGPIPLIVSGPGPGHLGHIDVTIEADPAHAPHGPDGARATLESYIGLPALRSRFGDALPSAVASGLLRPDRPPLAALVRAIRIAHAIYRPRRIALLGGVGLALRPIAPDIRAAAADALTSLAHEDWTLEIGDDDLHAARGAAWIAARAAPAPTEA